MRIFYKHIIGVLILLISLQEVSAQNYPVNTSVNIIPPYSVHLADYMAPGSNKLSVNLLLTQQNRPSFPVKLRVTIKGDGVTIRTNPDVAQEPIILQGGMMTTLSGSQLAPYLEANSLLFEGYSKSQYQKTGKLPEGIYQITVEALEINRGLVISNQGTTIGWFILNEPPRFNTPTNGALVDATDPQRVYFQWLPLHRNSPNAAFTTEYEFTIVEIYPEGRNPNDAILSSTPVTTFTTINSSLLYDQSYPALIPGRSYAVRVQARDQAGLDLFVNNGYSQVIQFTFGEPCNPPVNVRAESETPLRGKIEWDAQHNHSEFVVKYREANNPNANWFEHKTFATNLSLTDLKPDTNYEYTLQPKCGTITGKTDRIYQFTTLDKLTTDQEINCGNGNTPPLVDQTTQLLAANTGMMIKVGLFDMKTTKIEGSNGSFSGEGEIFIPYLLSTVKVTFSNIKVNENAEMYEGEVKAQQTGLSLLSAAEIADLAQSQTTNELQNDICQPMEENEGQDQSEILFKAGDTVITLSDSISIAKGDTVIVNGEEVIVDENTKFEEGDTVEVGDDVVTIGQDTSASAGTNGGTTGGTGSSSGVDISEQGSSILNKKINNFIEDALKALRESNKQLLDQNRSSVETLSDQIKTKISGQNLIPDLVLGKNEELIGEGMSEKITIPDESFADSNQPIIEIYNLHREIYKSDLELTKNKKKDSSINTYLNNNKIKADSQTQNFIDRVYDKLGQIGVDSLTYYDQNSSKRKEIEPLVIKSVEEAIEEDLAEDPSLGFNLDINHLNLYASAKKGLDWIGYVTSDETQPVEDVFMTPSVKATALHKIIVENKRIIGLIDPGVAIDLPVGLSQTHSGLNYIIAIENMTFKADGAFFDAFMSMEIPFSTKSMAFSTSGVAFTPGGMKVASAKMMLMKDYPLRMSNKVKLTLKADEGSTFVEFDCDGYKSLSIKGEFEFCENMIVPEDENGEIIAGERVKARFSTTITDWNDFIISAEIDPFQFTNREGLSISVTQAVLDMSDVSNPNGIVFPSEYNSSYFAGANANMWRGFYIQQAVVKLPKQMKDKDKEGKRVELGAKNLIIDEMGVTGEIFGKNLIQNGDLGGWNYSLDEIHIAVEINQFKKANFSGQLEIPIAKNDKGETKAFTYKAHIQPNNKYSFSVTCDDPLKFDLWAADVKLKEGSTVDVEVIDGQFKPSALLHGTMDINAGKAELVGINFEGLKLQTEQPKLAIKAVSFSSGKNGGFANFPITISNIGVRTEGDRIGLDLDVKINLMGESEQGFSGDTDITVWGKEYQNNGSTGWKYETVQVDEIGIDIVGKAYELHGKVTFIRGDEVYGDGFKGELDAKFAKIGVKATALFGKVGSMRYWYADAMAVLPAGVPILPPLEATGFGGGAYHHMRQQGFGEKSGSNIGSTPSGIVYLPDNNTHLGIKATVLLAIMGKQEVMNGEVTLDINFNRHGGVNQIGFKGNGKFITSKYEPNNIGLVEGVKNLGNKGDSGFTLKTGGADGSICGKFSLLFDNVNDVFHGETELYINLAKGVVKGIGDGGRAGWAVIHFEPGEWYIHVGSPDDPIGLSVLSILESRSYFMVGDHIPGSPPPPARVSQILGGADLNYMRDENALSSGRGFAFGMHFGVDTGDLNFLIFYARFALGAGMDVMLKDYGDARCAGRSGTLGVNGWYANGQAYAFVEGEIGIQVKIFRRRKSFSILDIGMAAVLQAKGPDPFWMKGIAGGYYRILGGMVKGNCKFEFTIGEECEIIQEGSPLDNIDYISDLTPVDGENDVNVFNASQAVFSMPVGKIFELKDFGENIVSYRAKLDYFKLVSDGRNIEGALTWNDDKDVVAFDSYDILPAMKKIQASVQIGFEQKENGVWVSVKDTNGKVVKETKEINFKTGKAPDHIPANNVAYSYPIIDQFNFYKDESSSGYIQLKKGQPELFNPGKEWVQKVRLTPKGEEARIINMQYVDRQVKFNVPGSSLANGKIYNLQVINLPEQTSVSIDQNVSTGSTQVGGNGEAANFELTTKSAEGNLNVLQEKEIFGLYFRTSEYNTFLTKFNSMTRILGWRRPIRTGIHELGSTLIGPELFDNFEINGNGEGIAPLIQYEAELNDNSYYQDYVEPLVYRNYPVDGLTVSWRDAEELGVPPVRGIYFRQYPYDKKLTQHEISAGQGGYITDMGAIIYNLPHYYAKDYLDLQQQVATKYANSKVTNDRLKYLLITPFPKIRYGEYRVKVRYVLPNGKVNAVKNIIIQNPLPDAD